MAFVGLPVAFLLTASGLGLLVERAVRVSLPNGLLVPIGFSVAVTLTLSVYVAHLHLAVACAALVVAAVGGFALAGRSALRVLRLGAPGVAGLAVYLLYAAPALATGHWTWLGYNFVNDTAVQFMLVEHLKDLGTAQVLPATTGGQTTLTFLRSGYPLGTHAYLATLSGLLGQDVSVVYQTFLAAMAATAAMALAVLGRAIAGAWAAAAIAALALASNLTFQYALQGNIKEIGAIAACCTTAAVAAQLIRGRDPIRLAVLLGLAVASILSVYNAAGGPYAAAFGLVVAAVVVVVHGREAFTRRWVVAGTVLSVTAVVAAVAALTTALTFYDVASAVVAAKPAGGEEFGPLGHRLPLTQSSGIWLDGRYFEPIEPGWRELVTGIGGWIVAGLMALALVAALRRRRVELLVVLVPLALASAFIAPRVSPYADGKLLAILSPGVLMAAGIGTFVVWSRARIAGIAIAAMLVALVGISDSFAFHDTKPAPRDRLDALQDAASHAPGRGLVLSTEFEEFAKYYDPQDRINVSSDSITPRPLVPRGSDVPNAGRFGYFFDLDEMALDYVEGFDTLMIRRSPVASRPPSNFVRVYANRYYEVWRQRGTAARVLVHEPLGAEASAAGRASCGTVESLLSAARRTPGAEQLVAAVPARTVELDTRAVSTVPSWPPNGVIADVVTLAGPGRAAGVVAFPATGIYDVAIRGDFVRRVSVLLDGRPVGSAGGVNTPRSWLPVTAVRVTRGRHMVGVSRGGGMLRPGDGSLGILGPVAFTLREPARLERVALHDARSLCGRRLDWIELVRR